jgi:PAS domain-containing protein
MLGANDKTRRAQSNSLALDRVLRASDGILDMLPIATFVCDAAGTILQYNQRAVEIWGAAPRPGQTHEDFTAGVRFFDIDGKPLDRSGFAEVMASGQAARDLERTVERADGSRVIVSLNIDPLRNAKGEIIGAVNCFLDITERKRTEAALKHSRLVALEQEQRLAATYEHAAIGISEIAPDGSFLRVNEAICGITGFSREHLLASTLFRHTPSLTAKVSANRWPAS